MALFGRTIEVGQLVGRHHLDLGQHVCGILLGVADAGLDPAAGNADLVNQLAVLDHVGIVGQATQDVNGPH